MYETGALVAFIFWAGYTAMLVVSLNSTLARNMSKIGLRLSWTNMAPKSISTEDLNRTWIFKIMKVVMYVISGLLGVLFSWVTVAMQIGSLIYVRMKDSGAPQAIKDYRWKMKNREMSFDEIVAELLKISDQPPESFGDIRDQMRQELADRGVLRS